MKGRGTDERSTGLSSWLSTPQPSYGELVLPSAARSSVAPDPGVDVRDALAVAAETMDRLEALLASDDVDPEAARRLRHLRSDLSSHVLAAQVLVDAGASGGAVAGVVQRASAIVDQILGARA